MPKSGDTPPDTPVSPHPQQGAAAPDVIVEFLVEGEVLVVCVRNVGSGCAHRVRVGFEPEFRGLGGTLRVPGLALFERLRFLAPGREIRALVDIVTAYFARGEPEQLEVTVTYGDDAGRHYRRRISHDLGVFRDLPRLGSH